LSTLSFVSLTENVSKNNNNPIAKIMVYPAMMQLTCDVVSENADEIDGTAKLNIVRFIFA
jgi:hypothetical protein